MKVCDKTCIFCFFPIFNKYRCMAKRSLLSERPSYNNSGSTLDATHFTSMAKGHNSSSVVADCSTSLPCIKLLHQYRLQSGIRNCLTCPTVFSLPLRVDLSRIGQDFSAFCKIVYQRVEIKCCFMSNIQRHSLLNTS